MASFGKLDGLHFNLSIGLHVVAVFFPATKWTHMVALAFGTRLLSRPGVFLPHIYIFRTDGHRTFTYMRHLRAPFNVVRVGQF